MIQLRSNCLVCETDDGEHIPFSAESLSEELVEQLQGTIDPEVIRHAAESVVQFYRDEQMLDVIRLSEFVDAITEVLRSLGFEVAIDVEPEGRDKIPRLVSESDLGEFSADPSSFSELELLPKLRASLRQQFETGPHIVRITGLKLCVKTLSNARRWSPRCQRLHELIVNYLQECWIRERNPGCEEIVIQ